MQPGTVAALPYPLRHQLVITANRLLSARDLNGLIAVDSSLGPVTVTLPLAASIQAGGFFQILALTGNVNPVSIVLQAGNTFNQGLAGPLVLNEANQELLVVGATGTGVTTRWWFLMGGASAIAQGAISDYVYRPGGVAVDNVYTSFASLALALQAQAGPKRVEVDDSIVPIPLIPAGVFDVNDAIFLGRPGQQLTLLRGSVGSQLQNLGGLGTNLQLQCNDAALPLYALSANEILNIEDGASLFSLVAGPVVAWAGPGAAAIRLQASEFPAGGGGPAVGLSGGAGESLVLFVYEGSIIGTNTVINDAGSILTFNLRDFGANVSRTQAGAVGTVVFTSIPGTGNAVPTLDNAFDFGDLDAGGDFRWRSTVSRLSIAVERDGAGGNDILYGANSVGRITGGMDSVAGSTARLQITNPATPGESASEVSGSVRATLAGGTAEIYASGRGASARGAVLADTADIAAIRATGHGSQASGYARTNAYAATILASALGAFACGYAQPAPGAGYGAALVQATGFGSQAMGAVQYFGTLEATGIGATARGTVAGGPFAFGAGIMTASGIGSFASGLSVGGDLIASGDGAHAFGRTFSTVGAGGADPLIQASGNASFAMGHAVGPNAVVRAANAASFAFGLAFSYATDAYPSIETLGAQAGSFAMGVAAAYATFTGRISGEENGAFAFGCCYALTADAAIQSTDEGSFAVGFARNANILAAGEGSFASGYANGGNITASGQGAVAHGNATGAAPITASGRGSFATGYSGAAGSIIASADNTVQFGPGTNSVADTVRVGGAGLHFKGTTGAFAALANGQFWVAGGNIYARTGGVSKNLTNIP